MVYAISDLHMSIHCPKPMDIFGEGWENYIAQIEEDWKSKVQPQDVVLIGGDISWAMTLAQAVPDLTYIASLPGQKVICKGNHDFWWNSISKVREALPIGMYALQNDCIRLQQLIVCGSRGWTIADDNWDKHDEKLYLRESLRMELSLQQMQKMRQEDDLVVVLMHYPPFNARREDSLFTDLFQKYNIHTVVYGHLHGNHSRNDLITTKGGITYYLTSCDQVNNHVVKIVS